MTASTLMFLCLLSCAVCWGAKWMREWEERDHSKTLAARELQEWWERERGRMGQTINCRCVYVPLLEYGHPTEEGGIAHDLLDRKNKIPVNWIPAKFCKTEYLNNEVDVPALHRALWPEIREQVLDPLEELEKDLEKANQPIVDKILNRFNPPNPETDPVDSIKQRNRKDGR